jgi:hypothetical protein
MRAPPFGAGGTDLGLDFGFGQGGQIQGRQAVGGVKQLLDLPPPDLFAQPPFDRFGREQPLVLGLTGETFG